MRAWTGRVGAIPRHACIECVAVGEQRMDTVTGRRQDHAVNTTNDNALLDAATAARKQSHSPYSGYQVGAAVLDENEQVHVGCNVENASYPEGICAEANAIGSMITNGGRRIVAIAIVGGPDEQHSDGQFTDIELCTPCGGCRQRILEFADAETRVLMQGTKGVVESGIGDLLPLSFNPSED